MKRIILLGGIALFSLCVFSGCAMIPPTQVIGGIYTSYQAPYPATTLNTVDVQPSKSGSASCVSVLGLVAVGDASIDAAMRDGDITKVHHIDYDNTRILGVYAKLTVIVYGE
ncbi:MAG: TRL-like family protein [bacterium]